MATIKFAPEKVFGMVPAGMNRKARIESLEKTAANDKLPEGDRVKAWDEAGRLKALQKAMERQKPIEDIS